MALKRGSPWWLTLVTGVALVAIFVGERIVSATTRETLRSLLTGVGSGALVGVLVWRVLEWTRATGARRRVERVLSLGSLGCVIAVALYHTTSGAAGFGWLHVDPTDPKSRFADIVTVLWPIVLLISIVPMIAAEVAQGARRSGDAGGTAGEATVEAYRILEVASGGLTAALAAATLFVGYYVATERDHKVDLSYFRTSMPGDATTQMFASLDEPMRVLLFFPEVNEVRDEARAYFDALAAKTGKVEVESLDRMVAAKEAKQYRVFRDGMVVLVRGDRNESIALDVDFKAAREKLRVLDGEVQKAFLKVSRASRTVYLTIGHGEMNDPSANNTTDPPGIRGAAEIKRLLADENYKTKDFGLAQGSAQAVPDDAAFVMILGPRQQFLDEELAALDRYLERGGGLFVALDPSSETTLGPLEARLGLRYDRTPLADDKLFYPARHNKSDYRWVETDQFSSHASVTSLSRSAIRAGLATIESGSFAETPNAKDDPSTKRTFVVRTHPTTWADANDNNNFDEGEKRQVYNLVAAVEGPVLESPEEEPATDEAPAEAKPAEGSDKDKDKAAKDKAKKKDDKKRPKQLRAILMADAELAGDLLVGRSLHNHDLVQDTVRWLGGEELFAGQSESEKDVRIQHTKSEDVAWFYATILGAPILVLGGGLLGVWRRRSRRSRSDAKGSAT